VAIETTETATTGTVGKGADFNSWSPTSPEIEGLGKEEGEGVAGIST